MKPVGWVSKALFGFPRKRDVTKRTRHRNNAAHERSKQYERVSAKGGSNMPRCGATGPIAARLKGWQVRE